MATKKCNYSLRSKDSILNNHSCLFLVQTSDAFFLTTDDAEASCRHCNSEHGKLPLVDFSLHHKVCEVSTMKATQEPF